MSSKENAEKWIQEDILNNYNADYRVHIVRVNKKIVKFVQNACIRNSIVFRNHTLFERLSDNEKNKFKFNL